MSSKAKSKRTVDAMLLIYQHSWVQVLRAVAKVAGWQREYHLDSSELEALDGRISPAGTPYVQGVPG